MSRIRPAPLARSRPGDRRIIAEASERRNAPGRTQGASAARRRLRAFVARRFSEVIALSEYVVVARLADVKPDSPLVVPLGDREIALFRIDDALYAIDDACPHQGAPLSEGIVRDGTVTCPWHAWCFNLADGTAAGGSGGLGTVNAFDVRIVGDEVSVASEPKG